MSIPFMYLFFPLMKRWVRECGRVSRDWQKFDLLQIKGKKVTRKCQGEGGMESKSERCFFFVFCFLRKGGKEKKEKKKREGKGEDGLLRVDRRVRMLK